MRILYDQILRFGKIIKTDENKQLHKRIETFFYLQTYNDAFPFWFILWSRFHFLLSDDFNTLLLWFRSLGSYLSVYLSNYLLDGNEFPLVYGFSDYNLNLKQIN